MRFLVGLDGSPEALTGLDLLGHLELSADDEVWLVSAVEVPSGVASIAGPPTALVWYDSIREREIEEANRIVTEAAATLQGRVRTSTEVREGHPLVVLPALARSLGADLILVGPHGRGRLESLVIGSVSQELLHSSSTPILVARPVRDALRTVVVAVDGSAHGRAAVSFLATLPLPAGTNAICTTVIPTGPPAYGNPWPDDIQAQVDADHQAAAAEVLRDAASRLADRGLAVTTEVRHGMPKEEILRAASEHRADLLVLGARGLGGFEGLLLGSVSRAVSKAAECSVLVVRQA